MDRGLVQKDMKAKDIIKQHSIYCQKEKDTKNFAGETLGYVTPVSYTFLSSQKHACIILTPLNPTFIYTCSKSGIYRVIHNFSCFCSKTYVVGTHENRLIEVVLMSTHNLCFEQKYEKY